MSIVSSICNCTAIGTSLACDKVRYRNEGILKQVYVDGRMQTCGPMGAPPACVKSVCIGYS